MHCALPGYRSTAAAATGVSSPLTQNHAPCVCHIRIRPLPFAHTKIYFVDMRFIRPGGGRHVAAGLIVSSRLRGPPPTL